MLCKGDLRSFLLAKDEAQLGSTVREMSEILLHQERFLRETQKDVRRTPAFFPFTHALIPWACPSLRGKV